MTWNAQTYQLFEDARNQPCIDLIQALTASDFKYAIDLGCGPGNSTELLQHHFPRTKIVGLDSSHSMLAQAQRRLPNTHFIQHDITTWLPSHSPDLIFSNAALHWIPEHSSLFPRLIHHLSETGTLACQMPDNLEEPAHLALQTLVKSPRWQSHFSQLKLERPTLLSEQEYWQLLHPLCKTVRIWRTTYYHEITTGIRGVAQWFKGSALVPYLAALNNEQLTHDFYCDYESILHDYYPVLSSNTVLLPFPRLFIVAQP